MSCDNVTAEFIYIVRGFVVFIIIVVIVTLPFLAWGYLPGCYGGSLVAIKNK
jgi:uncharacterized membrane protein